MCKCGSTSHLRTNHKDCPLNNVHASVSIKASVVHDDDVEMCGDEESVCSSIVYDSYDEHYCFSSDDDIYYDQYCSCNSTAHKRDCILNPRNRRAGHSSATRAKPVICSSPSDNVCCVDKGDECSSGNIDEDVYVPCSVSSPPVCSVFSSSKRKWRTLS